MAAKDRRARLHETIDKGEALDPTPVELPAGTRHRKRTIADEIQDQIAIQTAKKHGSVIKLSPEQIRDELLDLEDDGPSDPMYSQYEYTDMADEGIDLPAPRESRAPPAKESEPTDPLVQPSEPEPPPE